MLSVCLAPPASVITVGVMVAPVVWALTDTQTLGEGATVSWACGCGRALATRVKLAASVVVRMPRRVLDRDGLISGVSLVLSCQRALR